MSQFITHSSPQLRNVEGAHYYHCSAIRKKSETVIMPIFSKTFDVKTIPARGKRANDDCPVIKENLDDFTNISINFGNKVIRFQDARWILEQNQTSDESEGITLKRHIQNLEQINNLNQVKIDVLLDMMTEYMADKYKQQ